MSGDGKKMNVVSFERSKRTPDAARIAEFSATARKLLRERSSGDVIARLLRDTPREEWPRIAENEEIRNSGALDRLSRDAAAALEKDPTEVIVMAVRGMLPVNKLRDGRLARLKVYAGVEHQHEAQKPRAISVKETV